MNNEITAIILTKNEELHIRRCIEGIKSVCSKIFVIDSFSNDKTCEYARDCGATVLQHIYTNQAQQFQWALDNCPIDTEWVLRLDADEYLTGELVSEIKERLPNLSREINGVFLPRKVKFLGRILQFGNLRPIRILRLWRTGSAYMEQRWMDEQLVLKEGGSIAFRHCFIDDNLNGLSAWTQKHNQYSNREILTQLDSQYSLFKEGSDETLKTRNRKKSLYYRMPRFLRALGYFFVRYIVFLGFLDGIRGLIWLTLQAFWYRFLVDSKMYEMEKRLGKNPPREEVIQYVRQFYQIEISE